MARIKMSILSISPPAYVLDMKVSLSSYGTAALIFFSGGVIVLIILVILIVLFIKFVKPNDVMKLIGRNKKKKASMPEYWSGNLIAISHFDFRTLKKATHNFDHDNLLGRGGFGPVYRGKLGDGRIVAVKKLSIKKSKQGESEFLAEVRMMTSIQHKNLVRLIGCCSEGSQRLLVYEYMKNKSLDFLVYGNSDEFLDWNTRFQIILGIARGLQYLHEDSHHRIIHRDIKASNILLDEKFQPRISDFGLARFFPEDQAYLSTNFAGTVGYTAPEYVIRGELSEKADIYSFGVLVLEIISCRKNTDLTLPAEKQYLPKYAFKLRERAEIVDPKLQKHGSILKEVLVVMNVALLCIQPQAHLRPRMSEVVAMLTCKTQVYVNPVKPPAFLSRRRMRDDYISSTESTSEVFQTPLHSHSRSLSQQSSRRCEIHDLNDDCLWV